MVVQGEAAKDLQERPLRGVRVLDTTGGPAAAISRLYADLGADVIRLEPPAGSADRARGTIAAGISLEYMAANLGKRIGTRSDLERLSAEADILIANRGDLDIPSLRAGNAALVVLSVSDFGSTEGFADWQGSDAVFHALTGELSRSGIPGMPPLVPPGRLAVNCAMAQATYASLVAFWSALATGRGEHLDFATVDGAAQALDPGYGISGSAAGGILANKLPRGRPDVRFMYPILSCRDGFVRLCVLAPRQWQGLFEWMGRPEEFADPSFNKTAVRFASRTLLPAMARFIATKTKADVEKESQEFGVPTAPVLDLAEVLTAPQFTKRNAFRMVDLPGGGAAPFPDGALEIDDERMGAVGQSPPPAPQAGLGWLPRPALPRPSAGGDHPFSGLRVLDLGVIVVGAESGRLFGDQGADVIKVESSQFKDGSRDSRYSGPVSPSFTTGHRNKRSLGINLRDPRGRALLLDLVRETDVLLSNFKGGTLESLGLDYATLKEINPRIIVVDSSAFGSSGPWARRMGYGPLVRASAGLTMQWRYPGQDEGFSDAITVYPDHVAARVGVIGAIAALIRRLRTGRGGQVSVSQAEVMLGHLAPQIAAKALEQAGEAIRHPDDRTEVHACAGDDEWCVVTLRDQADEQRLAATLGAEPLADWMARRSPREAMTILQQAGVPAAAMLRVAELPGFPYYVARGFFRTMQHPHISEPLTVEAAPIRAERLPDPPDRPAPCLAEHTAEILRERLGLPDQEVARLVEAGVLEQYAP